MKTSSSAALSRWMSCRRRGSGGRRRGSRSPRSRRPWGADASRDVLDVQRVPAEALGQGLCLLRSEATALTQVSPAAVSSATCAVRAASSAAGRGRVLLRMRGRLGMGTEGIVGRWSHVRHSSRPACVSSRTQSRDLRGFVPTPCQSAAEPFRLSGQHDIRESVHVTSRLEPTCIEL